MARDAKTQPTVNGQPLMVAVNHGSTASTTRPAGVTIVMWIGSVSPTNSIDGDVWIDTT